MERTGKSRRCIERGHFVWPLNSRSRSAMHRFSLAILVLAALSSGCCCHCCHWVRQKPFHVWHLWADWNTLGTPAIFCERIEHLPYESHRVGRYRWMYGRNPGLAGDGPIVPAGGSIQQPPEDWPWDPSDQGAQAPLSPDTPATLQPVPPEEPPSDRYDVPRPSELPPVPPSPNPPATGLTGSKAPAASATARTKGGWIWQSGGRNPRVPATR